MGWQQAYPITAWTCVVILTAHMGEAFLPSPKPIWSSEPSTAVEQGQCTQYGRGCSGLHKPLLGSATIKMSAVSAGRVGPPPKRSEDSAHYQYRPDRVPKDIDYVIVGSGIGGLWLAAALSKFGQKCLVLEQHYVAGGFQHTFNKGGFEFIPGLHYIANRELCEPLYNLVADPNFPITYKKAGDAVPADEGKGCSHELKIGSMDVLRVMSGRESIFRELSTAFPDEVKGIDEFLDIMEEAKWQAGMFMTFKIFHPWIQWLMSWLLCPMYMKYASMTTEQALAGLTKDGRLQTVLSAFGGDLGESLRDGSFVMQAAVLGHVIEGCWYPEGGPIQFVRGLIPTIRDKGGQVLTRARVNEIIVEDGEAKGVRLADGNIIAAKKGVVSNAGMLSTMEKLLSREVVDKHLKRRFDIVKHNSGGISHAMAFVGLNGTNEELGLRSASWYYIPCNVSKSMDASEVQDYYRDTLLDPGVRDVSAGIVFASAKDPDFAGQIMPGKSTAIIFSEARAEDFEKLADPEQGHGKRPEGYLSAKEVVAAKLRRALLDNFPQLEGRIEVFDVGTPLTVFQYTRRMETLGLRHTPDRMINMELRPDCDVKNLFFTGQDVAFAGWAGAMTGAMVAAQRILGYGLLDFAQGRSLIRDLGGGWIEDMLQAKTKVRRPK